MFKAMSQAAAEILSHIKPRVRPRMRQYQPAKKFIEFGVRTNKCKCMYSFATRLIRLELTTSQHNRARGGGGAWGASVPPLF